MSVSHVKEIWKGRDASLGHWYGHTFRTCKFVKSFFDDTDCTETTFADCELVTVDFSLSYLWESTFKNSELRGCKFDKTKLRGAVFKDCIMDKVEFFAVEHEKVLTFKNCEFKRCKLSGMTEDDFYDITWGNCVFDLETSKQFPVDFFVPRPEIRRKK